MRRKGCWSENGDEMEALRLLENHPFEWGYLRGARTQLLNAKQSLSRGESLCVVFPFP